MKTCNFFLSCLLFLIQFHLYSQAPSGFYIINGEEIEIDEAPWQVSLEVNGGHYCGGVILNENWILTAAHCVKGGNNCIENIIVHAGATDQTNDSPENGQRIPADMFIAESWKGIIDNTIQGSNDNNDLALIHLSTPLSFNDDVQPIDFASGSTTLPYGNNGVLTGWGTTENGTLSDVLRKTEIELITLAQHEAITSFICQGTLPVELQPNENNIIFYSNLSSAGAGDSGGPATMNINGNPTLVGVTSRRGSCIQELSGGGTQSHLFSIYTKVQNYEDFILDHIGDEVVSHCGYKHTLPKNIRNTYRVYCPMSVTHDVTVKTGATLTISDEVYFGSDISLIVEPGATLIIDGGILTSCDPQNPWKGIKLKGNNLVSS